MYTYMYTCKLLWIRARWKINDLPGVFRVLGFFSSPVLFSVFVAAYNKPCFMLLLFFLVHLKCTILRVIKLLMNYSTGVCGRLTQGASCCEGTWCGGFAYCCGRCAVLGGCGPGCSSMGLWHWRLCGCLNKRLKTLQLMFKIWNLLRTASKNMNSVPALL